MCVCAFMYIHVCMYTYIHLKMHVGDTASMFEPPGIDCKVFPCPKEPGPRAPFAQPLLGAAHTALLGRGLANGSFLDPK